MGMILRIASSRIVGQGDIVGRSGYFSLNLSANSVMRGRLDARRTLKSLVADLRFIKISEKLCVDRLEKRVASQPEGEKDYEVYVASQKEMSLTAAGKRKWVERILFRSIVFIRCTDTLRRKEIVHLPYIKRFMVNIAGERRGGIRPVAFIPDDQMAKLRRIVGPVL